MLQVYGLLSNATQWWFYSCDPNAPHPVSFYTLNTDPTHTHSVSDEARASRSLLEHLLGFLTMCLKEATHS